MISTIPPLNTEKHKSHVIILTCQKVKKKNPYNKGHKRHSLIIKFHVGFFYALMVVTILTQYIYIKKLKSKLAHLKHYGPFLNIKPRLGAKMGIKPIIYYIYSNSST